jgi:hypothetical protein
VKGGRSRVSDAWQSKQSIGDERRADERRRREESIGEKERRRGEESRGRA